MRIHVYIKTMCVLLCSHRYGLHIYMPHAHLNRRCLADAGVKVGDASFAADALSCVGHGLIEPKKTF